MDRAAALQRLRHKADARNAGRADGRGRAAAGTGGDRRRGGGKRRSADGPQPRKASRRCSSPTAPNAGSPPRKRRMRSTCGGGSRPRSASRLGDLDAGGDVLVDDAPRDVCATAENSNPCRGLRRRKTGFEAQYLTEDEFAGSVARIAVTRKLRTMFVYAIAWSRRAKAAGTRASALFVPSFAVRATPRPGRSGSAGRDSAPHGGQMAAL